MTTKIKMTLTANEIAVIRAFKVDRHVKDYGWRNPVASAWTHGFNNDCGLAKNVFAGTMSSLSKKGIIDCYNYADPQSAFFCLTAAGREVAEDIH